MAKKEKTPFQESKRAKIEDKKAEIEAETTETPGAEAAPDRGKPKRKYTRKKKVEFVAPTMEETAVEAQFFLEFITKLRQGAGIQKVLPDFYHKTFIMSYHTMAAKYGAMMSMWLPELMFGGTLLLIGVDTLVELKRIKIAEAATKKAEAETDKKDITGADLPTDDILQKDAL